MHNLRELLKRMGQRRAARWWIGARPEVRDGQLLKSITAKVGYPTSADDPFTPGGLKKIGLQDASFTLAMAATRSLAHGSKKPSVSSIREVRDALLELGGNATFFGNGTWQSDDGSAQWTPLSNATFDCGVLGYDTAIAFIFWVEEED